MKTNLLLLMLSAGVIFSSCKGDTGGPQGDPGPKGDTGQQGAAGTQGPKGETGTANVIQYTFEAPSTVNGIFRHYTLSTLPTGVNLMNSVVMVYARPASNGFWTALPDFIPGPNEFFGFDVDGPVTVTLMRKNTVNGTEISSATPLRVRILVIPASILRSGRYSSDFFKDYDRVKQEFNLPN